MKSGLEELKQITVQGIGGETRRIGDYGGDLLLVVNTASRCGFTPQLEGLEALHRDYQGRGLRVLGFPSNDFAQELDSEEQVARFCQLRHGVSFPMHARVHVNGSGAHPLFRALARLAPGVFGTRKIKWNFTKFLVDLRTGQVRRFAPSTTPEELRVSVEAALGATATSGEIGAGQEAHAR